MAKKKRSTSRRYIPVIAVILVLAAAAIAAILSQQSADTQIAQNITPDTYQQDFLQNGRDHFLLDVRTPEEFNSGHINSAVNISVETLETHLAEVPTDKPIVVYCRSGNRSAQAADILEKAGYTSIYDMGGINDWVAQGYPVE